MKITEAHVEAYRDAVLDAVMDPSRDNDGIDRYDTDRYIKHGLEAVAAIENRRLERLRIAYLALRKPPWTEHDKKMVELYRQLDLVLGTQDGREIDHG